MSQPPPDSSQPSSSKDTSYTVFNAVDAAVAKNVVGSDGAANWQAFRQQTNSSTASSSVAPKAPLKALDRALGFQSWQDEIISEQTSRMESGARAMHSGYQHFRETAPDDTTISAKERRRIEEKRLGTNQPYYIPADQFQGWKWDYVFTTRAPRGTGYYFDGTDSVLELDGKRKRPIVISEEEEVVPKKKAKTKKPKKAKAIVKIVQTPHHPLEQVQALVRNNNSRKPRDLPDGWECALDSSTQRPYYFHRVTGERRWDRPHTTTEWNEAKDPTTGNTYYYHQTTGETSWDPPVQRQPNPEDAETKV